MKYIYIIGILILIIIMIIFVINTIIKQKEKSFIDSLISSGITIIISFLPNFSNLLIELFASLFNKQIDINNEVDYIYIIIGFIMIFCGISLKILFFKRTLVLNMYGIAVQKNIYDAKSIKDLKLNKFIIEEYVIDLVHFFNEGINMSKNMNKNICKYIECSVNRFSIKSENQKETVFTGMAPIPYTVYAGSFSNNARIKRYFEYDGRNLDKYYEIKKEKRVINKKNYQDMITVLPDKIIDCEDILLVISITHKISDEDIKQFNMCKIQLMIENCKDNIIKYTQQLEKYKEKFYECINVTIPTLFPSLKRIHIVASIPSCFAVEIGKVIGLRKNRINDIIVYHFNRAQEQKYVFGLYVNGNKKGELYKEK